MNQGMISEYYDIVQSALRVDLNREPTHDEIMKVVIDIINYHVKGQYV